jgi:hypothetical protein
MAHITHQTIKLSKGKHASPEEGACVMELASMLAGERFTDRPVSVCPVIGAFLRAYNDSIDDRRRQDLYAYAAKVVGTRASRAVQRTRAERLAAWASELRQRRWTRFFLAPRLRALALEPQADFVGTRAVSAIRTHDDDTHRHVLALVDELLAIGTSERAGPAQGLPAARSQRSPQPAAIDAE